MNDLEAKLRALTFREPPPGLRGAVLAVAQEKSSWRTWLAPHPAAWAALAAVWIALAVLSRLLEEPTSSARGEAAKSIPFTPPTLLAFQRQIAAEQLP